MPYPAMRQSLCSRHTSTVGPHKAKLMSECPRIRPRGEEVLHIINEGNIPTFEIYRDDCQSKSAMDITACSTALLADADYWRVELGATSSDHNSAKAKTPMVIGRLKTIFPNEKKGAYGSQPPPDVRTSHVVEEYVKAKKIYEGAAAEVQTASWKRFYTAQNQDGL
ncbi:hypothetical protein EVAR_43109_1 [Eumeta japonica]|uniref:Uncharacterized protein n=1 Tax=Eumeta variegata TaxID=151549 RepID=A0A4C1YII4_EUMVA|nr:hypothetical protein EVAR_43109_1 [Eumeta japonica]